jgi:acyl transferase domain-containing protein
MFAGQGSQHHQMGKVLYENHPVFRGWMERLDAEARSIMGRSVIEAIYGQGRAVETPFDGIGLTHPAIFSVQYALYRVFAESGIMPDAVLGVSLGEYVAAAAAEVCSWQEMLSIVVGQADIIERQCPKGAMCAVLDDPDLYTRTPLLREKSELAASHYPGHFVVSGGEGEIAAIEAYLEREDIAFLHLPVSFGFHSALMEPCAETFRASLEGRCLGKPRIGFYSCQRAREMSHLPADHWWEVVRRPVAFQRTIEALEEQRSAVYVDLGPLGTLANFAKQNFKDDSASEALHVLTPFGKESTNLQRALERLSNGTGAGPMSRVTS